MAALKLETGDLMIEINNGPAFRRMAKLASFLRRILLRLALVGICMTFSAPGRLKNEIRAHEAVIELCLFVAGHAGYGQVRAFQRIICFLMSLDIKHCGRKSIYIMTFIAFPPRFSSGELTAMMIIMTIGASREVQAVERLARLVALVTGDG
jgi:hypothetical protein